MESIINRIQIFVLNNKGLSDDINSCKELKYLLIHSNLNEFELRGKRYLILYKSFDGDLNLELRRIDC